MRIELPPASKRSRSATADDGTQIWKITHNGVDTHPIHFHLFDVQLINRVGWDGIIRRPGRQRTGLEGHRACQPAGRHDGCHAPVMPKAPFGLPDSIRPLNPMMPLGSTGGFNNVDTNGNPHRAGHRESDRQLRLGVRLALPHPQP